MATSAFKSAWLEDTVWRGANGLVKGAPKAASPPHPVPIVVLMRVGDGTEFLDAQISSILGQTLPDVRLVIRDLGSSGETRRVLHDWRRDPRVLILRGDPGEPRSSVLDMLGLVDHREIVALANEDAIWHPEKLARALAMVETEPDDGPALYFSRAFLIGADATVTEATPRWPRRPGFGNALVEDIAAGSTILLNRPAVARLKTAGTPAGLITPGWWCYLVISAFGTCTFDPWPSVLLRKSVARSPGDHDLGGIVEQARAFLVHFGISRRLSTRYRRLARGLARGSGLERRATVIAGGLHRQFPLDNARFHLRALAGPWPECAGPPTGGAIARALNGNHG